MAMAGWCRSVVLSFKNKQNKIKPRNKLPKYFGGDLKLKKKKSALDIINISRLQRFC